MMKKRILIIIFALSLIVSLVSLSASESDFVSVDDRVEYALAENTEVSVIVMLKDDYSAVEGKGVSSADPSNLKTKKQMIKSQQEKVLSGLNLGSIKKSSSEKETSNKIKAGSEAGSEFEIKHQYNTINGFSGKITRNGLEKLKNNPNVKGVYFNGIKQVTLDASVPLINATKTWSLIYNSTVNITGAGETVCVIDTGVDYTHTDMGGCTSASFLEGNCSKVIGGYDYYTPDSNPIDDHGHGTHCAGIVASENEVYKGVAPDAKIVALKVCSAAGSCPDADIISGIDWCTNNASKYNISVISISLGGSTNYSDYCDANASEAAFISPISGAVEQNVSVVIAAGNYGHDNMINSPACIQNATPIGAINDGDCIDCWGGEDTSKTGFNRAPNLVEILAPGISIMSLDDGGGTISYSGTSMSTPHAAGAFALINQYRRLEGSARLTPHEIEDALNDTGKAVADGADIYRRINIYAAILSLDSTAPTISFTSPTPDNNSKVNTTWFFVNITSDEILTSAVLEINNTNQTMDGSVLNWYFNKTNLSRQTYSYRVYGNDSAGNIGVSETRYIYINNTTPAQPALNLPLNNSYTTVNWTLINWTSFDDDNDTMNCYVYGDNTTDPSNLINKTTGTENGSTSTFNWTSLNETTYYWKIRCDDSVINSSFSSIFNFTVDLTYPQIDFAGGTGSNDSYIKNNWLYINVSVTEPNFNNITFLLYNSSSAVNETNLTTADYSINFTGLKDGSYYYNVTIRDKTGKSNSTETRKTTIDTAIPTTNVSLTSAEDYDKDGNIELNWTDDLAELYSKNLTITYRILRSTEKINSSNIGSSALISNTTTNTTQFFEDNTTLHNTTYFYAVVTVDSFSRFNDSVISVSLNATANDTIKPKIPSKVNVTGSGATATITWNNVTRDTNNNPDAYGLTAEIWYGTSVNTSKTFVNDTNSGFSWLKNLTNNENSTTWSTTAEGTTIYHFAVVTTDDAGNKNFTLNTASEGNYGNVSLTYTAPTTPSSGGGGGGGGGGGTTLSSGGTSVSRFWSVLTKGETIMELSRSEIAVSEIKLNMKNQVTNAELIVKKLDEKPTAVEEEPTGNIYQYIEIEKKQIQNADIQSANIRFKVAKSWIKSNNIDENSITLNKYTTRWVGLQTKKTGSDSTYVIYETTTSGFSYFAITGKANEINITEETTEINTTKEEENVTKEEPEEKEKEKINLRIPALIGMIILIAILCLIIFRTERMVVSRAKRRHKEARKHHHKAKRHHKMNDHHKAREHHVNAAIHHKKAAKHYLKTNKTEHIEKARHHENAAKKHIELIKHIDAGNFSEIARIDHELDDIDKKLGE